MKHRVVVMLDDLEFARLAGMADATRQTLADVLRNLLDLRVEELKAEYGDDPVRNWAEQFQDEPDDLEQLKKGEHWVQQRR